MKEINNIPTNESNKDNIAIISNLVYKAITKKFNSTQNKESA